MLAPSTSRISTLSRDKRNVATPTLYLVVPLAPLLAAIVVGLFGARLGRLVSHTLCIAGVAISTLASYFVWRDVVAGHTFNGDSYVWLQAGVLKLATGYVIELRTA